MWKAWTVKASARPKGEFQARFQTTIMVIAVLTLSLSFRQAPTLPVQAASTISSPVVRVVDTINVGGDPLGIGYDPANKDIYVTGAGPLEGVSVIDSRTNTVIKTFTTAPTCCSAPRRVAFDAANNYMYISNDYANTVSVIDSSTNSIVTTIKVGDSPSGLAYDSVNHYVYVSNGASSTVSVIDSQTNSVISTIAGFGSFGSFPSGITLKAATDTLYVANAGNPSTPGSISEVNGTTNTVVATIHDDANLHFDDAYDPSNGYVYVTNDENFPYSSPSNPDTVLVIDSTSNAIVTHVPVGREPLGMVYNPVTRAIFVTNSLSDTISMIDTSTNSVTATVGVGSSPEAVTYDAFNGNLYVANYLSGTVSVIAVQPQQEISISEFFTDPSLNLLPLDSKGNPMVNVTLAGGVAKGTNPGQVLAWVNVTNTSGSAVLSLRLNDTLPKDWVVHPAWMPSLGAIHVFYGNGTNLANGTEITQPPTITVATTNPEMVHLAIFNFTATAIGHPLMPGQSILLSVKLSYGLIGTSQSATGYPINYTDKAVVTAWIQVSYSGTQSTGSGSAFFTADAKVVG